LDLNNALIVIKDPTTAQPFPGNIIPSSRLNANGLALMNILPLPNYDSPAQRIAALGNYNYQDRGNHSDAEAQPTLQDRLRSNRQGQILCAG
jgi:hypothetical protein